jgi:hypothetical protein
MKHCRDSKNSLLKVETQGYDEDAKTECQSNFNIEVIKGAPQENCACSCIVF